MAGHCWAVTSGKGGVGKSVIALGLAQAWRNEGKRVLLVDAHTGMANLDVLMGVNPTVDFLQSRPSIFCNGWAGPHRKP